MYGKQKFVTVSEEYLETVCDWLEKWATHDDSWIIAQFLKKHGIGWSYFKHFISISPKLENIFETVIAGLCEKWLLYAMKKENMPFHMQKILMKYLRVYDNHAYDVDQQAKKEIAREETAPTHNYVKEDYTQHQLEGVFKHIYELNTDKRRNKRAS